MRRDLRSAYLASLGIKTVQIQSSLEAVLKESPVDLPKLRKICEHFQIPAQYRPKVWQVLLGVLPEYPEAWEFVQTQRHEEYRELKHTCRLLVPPMYDGILSSEIIWHEQGFKSSVKERAVDENFENVIKKAALVHSLIYSSKKYCEVLKVEYSEDELLPYAREEGVVDEITQLQVISKVFCFVGETEDSAFWCFHNFLHNPLTTYGHRSASIYHQINKLSRLLENQEPDLSRHFRKINLQIDDFSYSWFKSFFASCMKTKTLPIIWDRIIGVSSDFTPYVALAILQVLKHRILDMNDSKDVTKFLSVLPDLAIEPILAKASDFFEPAGT